MPDLVSDLGRLDNRPYPAYRDLRGRSYLVGDLSLCLDHVQGDPFASPSRLRIEVPSSAVGLPDIATSGGDARRATADFFHRQIRGALAGRGRPGSNARSGSGKSGLVEIVALGQEVLDRTAVCVSADGCVTLRLSVGLPASGRRILGRAATELLVRVVPSVVARVFADFDRDGLAGHIACVEDQVALRAALAAAGLVAFLAEGSELPRRSGADDRPMSGAIPFSAPGSMRVSLEAPHRGICQGFGVREGVTLIVGGGYHGKSTLLQAISRGVYDHVPGDGREHCVSLANTVNVRAEDGRSVRGVDLRPFISNLPLGRSTQAFTTDDASGSTSQAASIVEAVEAGAGVLLIDEDTAATNFMIRDARMRALIPSAEEPITPYLDRVRQLRDTIGVSSILVVGGAGEYLDVADAVVRMAEYRPCDATERAHEVARSMPLGDAAPGNPGKWPMAAVRVPLRGTIDTSRGKRSERVRSVKTRAIEIGPEEVDVSLLAQLVDPAQCRMIGDALLLCVRELCDGVRPIGEILDELDARIERGGLASVCADGFGDRARARRFEIAAALNRVRSLKIAGP